jgi:hypothetical protein
MLQIFVSYRRTDSPSAAGRLCDHLHARFGFESVFRDIDSIEAGEDFDESIRDALRAAVVVLVVIGPRWIDARDGRGHRRLDDPGDYVRREIEIGLASDATLIPVLVEAAPPPPLEALPESLKPFAHRQAVELSDRRWNDDVRALLDRVDAALGDDAGRSGREPDGGRVGPSPFRSLLAPVTGYVTELVSLLKAPRRSLMRSVGGRRKDRLTASFVFFGISVLISDATLTGVYAPRDSVAGFLFAGFMLALLGTVGISAPLWIVWRAVGARRHYPSLLVILLYQIGVTHLLVIVAAAIGLFAIELRSLDVVAIAMKRALETGGSFDTAVESLAETLASAVDARTLLIASMICVIGAATATVFLVRSWSAYRDAFDVSRARSRMACFLILAMAALAYWASRSFG